MITMATVETTEKKIEMTSKLIKIMTVQALSDQRESPVRKKLITTKLTGETIVRNNNVKE